jgi:hypothetical protein
MGESVECGDCRRTVPIVPGTFRVSVPHIAQRPVGQCPVVEWPWEPCAGNEKRWWRDSLVHPAIRLAQQHAILGSDDCWDLP